MRLELFADLHLQRDAGVKHDAQQTNDFQILVQVGVHLLDGVDQVGQTFQRKVLTLHGHDHAMGRAQAVQGQHGQRRRAIDQHKIVVGIHRSKRIFEALVTVLELHQLHLGTSEFAVGAQHPVATFFGQHRRLVHRGRLQQDVVHAQLQLAFVDA